MDQSPRATLSRVIDHLGSTLLEVVAGEVGPDAGVGGVVIHDAGDPPELPDHALVLGVGVSGTAELVDLIRSMGDRSVAGVMARLPIEVDEELRQVVDNAGTVLLGLTRGASWAHVATFLRSLITVDDLEEGGGELPAGGHGDLFTLATAVSSLLDAPVTIEDLNSAVLAFSANQEEADDSRKEGILGRRVPERYTRELAERGIFRRVYSSSDPVFIRAFHEGDLSRVALRVCAGDEVLGSMWAAVAEPLSEDRQQAFVDSAKIVALQMLRQRAGADVERRLRTDLVATLIEGGPRAREAAERLGLAGGPSCVLALGLLDDGDALGLEAELQRARGALSLHLSAIQPSSAVALVGGVVYGVMRVREASVAAELRVLEVAGEFIGRLGSPRRMLIGLGRVADGPADLAQAGSDAVRALRVLRSGQVSGQTARSSDVAVQEVLLDVCALAADRRWRVSGSLGALRAHDESRGSALIETLGAWLDAFGDVHAAARSLHVHPNTFRYRLRRVAAVGGVDLDDPEARFAAMLELRMLEIMG